MEWLVWSFERQTYARRELVVVDGSLAPVRLERHGVRAVPAQPGSNVPVKRNLALAEARGEILAWFDDDHWQHPERLTKLVDALRAGHLFPRSTHSWFLDLVSMRCCAHRGRGPLFNGAGFDAELARSVRFDERANRASDTRWLHAVSATRQRDPLLLDPVVLSFWLCHDRNLSNARDRIPADRELNELRQSVGLDAWADTDERLQELRSRLFP